MLTPTVLADVLAAVVVVVDVFCAEEAAALLVGRDG